MLHRKVIETSSVFENSKRADLRPVESQFSNSQCKNLVCQMKFDSKGLLSALEGVLFFSRFMLPQIRQKRMHKRSL